jgi:hypothetical protein
MIRLAALIRQGKLCRMCSGKQCKDLGTDNEPIEIECQDCNGEGCQHCVHGWVRIVGCPNKQCSPVVDVVELVDLYAKGLPPIAGGSLDQAAWFIEAAKRLEIEEATIKAERQRG